MVTRPAAVAGSFYPRFKKELIDLIHRMFTDEEFGPGAELTIGSKDLSLPRKVIGGVDPHAGYEYSGCAAANTIQALCEEGLPDTVIIFGTTHTGYSDIATMNEGFWETPLGKIEIDQEITTPLINSQAVIDDSSAFLGFPHQREHNIEVQIPLLQYCAEKAGKEIKFVPVSMGKMRPDNLETVGKAVADVIQQFQGQKDIAMIASSDMTHHEPRDVQNPQKDIEYQREKDTAVMDAFEAYDWEMTYKAARDTTVCGPQCIATLMIAAQALGYEKTKKLKYYNSYEKMGGTGPCEYSVGYFSGIIFNE